jgi:hypothetical protein
VSEHVRRIAGVVLLRCCCGILLATVMAAYAA